MTEGMVETRKKGTSNIRRWQERMTRGDKEDKDNFEQKMTDRIRETRKTETPID